VPENRSLRICLPCAEISPLGEPGGLAEVTTALAHHYLANGHDCRVLAPLHGGIDAAGLELEEIPELQQLELQLGGRSFQYSIVRSRLPGQDLPVYLLRCPPLYSGQQLYAGADEHLRFILLCRAAIEMCQRLQFAPDIFHCHDWHTALVPVYLKTRYAWDRLFADSKTVLTIHNLGFQGVFGGGILYEMGLSSSPDMLDADDLDRDRINFLKTGIRHADLLTTVSPTYAREILGPEQGSGLESLLQQRREALIGILNGIDATDWDPAGDPHLAQHYSAKDLSGKESNKQALMQELGLEYAFDLPLVGMVSRLIYQKGIELVQQVLPELLKARPFALAVHGQGEAHHERFFSWLQGQFPGRVSFRPGLDPELGHRITAASDMYLMPSRFEPCGLGQLYSQRYGTVPVVRATGGLIDSVRHYDAASGVGTGVVFHDFDANGLRWAVNTALDLYANKHAWRQLVHNAMEKDFSWTRQGELYIRAFRKLM